MYFNIFGDSVQNFSIKKSSYDSECEVKYQSIKKLGRSLCDEPWNSTLRMHVLSNKKEFNRLLRKNIDNKGNNKITELRTI
jgi:hypothetical protein